MLGSDNPDWAVLVMTEAGERLYFVAEAKGTLLMDDLRDAEAAKIEGGKRHFATIARRIRSQCLQLPALPMTFWRTRLRSTSAR